jgi:hypothetical protein
VTAAALAALLVPAAPAAAHGIAGRADLPIPAELFGVAAAAVLVVSFVALAALWSTPRLERVETTPLLRIPPAADAAAGALGVLVFAVTAYAGLAGTGVPRDNLAPTMVYVVVWVGVPFASLLLGDVWRAFSPWRALGRATGALARRVGGAELPEPLEYPARLGRWPAAAGLLGFAVCELCWAKATEPGPLAVLMLAYLAVQLVGMSLYGVEAWTRNADALGVYFGLFALLAPLERRGGVVHLRPPGTGATRLRPARGGVAVLLVGIGATAFDGAKEGPLFNDLVPRLQSLFEGLGASKGTALELGFVVGLLGAIGVVALVWLLAVEGMPRLRGLARADLSRRLAHSLVPILAAYVVAHYFSLLVYNGQDAWRLASDPLGDGADLFGGARATVDFSVVSATAIWYVQVAALVVGHVTALVLAHDRALALYGAARDAARSQIVMLVVMVAFTCLGLWLLSEAL